MNKPPSKQFLQRMPVANTFGTEFPTYHNQTPAPTEDVMARQIAAAMGTQAALKEAAEHTQHANRQPAQPISNGNPFEQIILDLSGAVTGPSPGLSASQGMSIQREGYAIYYRKENSDPGGKLNIDLGGEVVDFYPGQRITGYFNRFGVRLSSRSSVSGLAQLILMQRPDIDYTEPPVLLDANGKLATLARSPMDTLLDATYSNVSDPLSGAGKLFSGLGVYQSLQLWVFVNPFTGGASPTVSLGLVKAYDALGGNTAGAGSLCSTVATAANLAGFAQVALGIAATGGQANLRPPNFVYLNSVIAGAPTTYSYRVVFQGYY